MLRRSISLVASLFVMSCARTQAAAPPVDRDAAVHAIEAALDDFHRAAAEADEARYFGHFAKDGVFLGTDATERWDVAAFRAYAHARFVKGTGWTYHPKRRAVRVSADGETAWFDEDLLGEKAGPCRGTGVFVRENGAYRIALYSLTVTVPNDRFAAVRAVIDAPALSPTQ